MTSNHIHSRDGRRSVKIFLRQPRITCSSFLCRAVDAIFFHSSNLGHSALSPKIVISPALIISQMESSCVHLVIDKPLKSCDLRKNTELEANVRVGSVTEISTSAGICHELRYYIPVTDSKYEHIT